MNVAVVLPAATVTEAGTTAKVVLLAKFTARPPAGAALLSVIAPVEELPPATLEGFTLIDESATEVVVIVRVAVLLLP